MARELVAHGRRRDERRRERAAVGGRGAEDVDPRATRPGGARRAGGRAPARARGAAEAVAHGVDEVGDAGQVVGGREERRGRREEARHIGHALAPRDHP